MDKEEKELLLTWLKDAHAMEQSLVQNLKEKAEDADEDEDFDMSEQIKKHTEETKVHAGKIASCIERLGGSISTVKEAAGKMFGYVQGAMKSMYSDAGVKNALEGYTAEHFEIACYTSLIAAANHLGDMQTAAVCEEILHDEMRMADWLESQIPRITERYLKIQHS